MKNEFSNDKSKKSRLFFNVNILKHILICIGITSIIFTSICNCKVNYLSEKSQTMTFWQWLNENKIDDKLVEFSKVWKEHPYIGEEELTTIPEEKRFVVLLDLANYNLSEKSWEEEIKIFYAMDKKLQIIYSAYWFDVKVYHDGLSSTFTSFISYFIYDSLDSLKVIGANKKATILIKAIEATNIFNKSKKDFLEDIYSEKLSYLYDDEVLDGKYINILDPLENEYYSMNDEDVQLLLTEYVKNNVKKIEEH